MVFVCRRLPANEKKNLCGLSVSVVNRIAAFSLRPLRLCGESLVKLPPLTEGHGYHNGKDQTYQHNDFPF